MDTITDTYELINSRECDEQQCSKDVISNNDVKLPIDLNNNENDLMNNNDSINENVNDSINENVNDSINNSINKNINDSINENVNDSINNSINENKQIIKTINSPNVYHGCDIKPAINSVHVMKYKNKHHNHSICENKLNTIISFALGFTFMTSFILLLSND